ncbi:hypothetical protein, partial [Georgenia sp.]
MPATPTVPATTTVSATPTVPTVPTRMHGHHECDEDHRGDGLASDAEKPQTQGQGGDGEVQLAREALEGH